MADLRQRVVILAVVGVAALIGAFLPAALTNTAREKKAASTTASTAERTGIEIGGTFALTDQDGRRVDEKTWDGKVRLLFFGFTHCPDVCPTTLLAMSDLLDQMGPAADQVVPMLVTVDPDRDSPEVLKDYIASFHPGTVALTGSPTDIAAVLRSFGAFARKVPTDGGDYTMDHTATIYLLDRTGRFRGTLDRHEEPAIWRQKVERVVIP